MRRIVFLVVSLGTAWWGVQIPQASADEPKVGELIDLTARPMRR